MGLLQQANTALGKTYTPTTSSQGGLLQQAKLSITQNKPTVQNTVSQPTPIQKAQSTLGQIGQNISNTIKNVTKNVSFEFVTPKASQTYKQAAATIAQPQTQTIQSITIKPGAKKVDLKQLEQIKPQTSATIKPELKNKFQEIQTNYKKKELPKGYKEPGILGSMVEAIKEGSVGLVGSLGSTTEMVGNMTNLIGITEIGKRLNAESKKILAENPEWAADPLEKWGTKKVARLVAGAVPSLLGVIGATLVGGPAGGVALGFAMEAGPTYEEAKTAGVSEDKARLYGTVVGTINGLLERVLPAEILKSKATKEVVKDIGKSLLKEVTEKAAKYGVKFTKNGTLEGSTEALQELWSNVIATNYDKNRKLWDNILESFVGGFGSGGIAGATLEGNLESKLPQGEVTPQEVINTVIREKAENTTEGKEIIKNAIEAQQKGQNIVVKKVETPALNIKGLDEITNKKIEELNIKDAQNPIEDDAKIRVYQAIAPGMETDYVFKSPEELAQYKNDVTNPKEEFKYIDVLPSQLQKAPNKEGVYQIIEQPIQQKVKEVKPTIDPQIPKVVEKEVGVARSNLPVGEGELKVSKLEARVKGVMGKATQEQIDKLGLATYNQMNKKENINKASAYVVNNTEEALKVLTGEIETPQGILRNSVYVAMQNLAKGDADLARKLASISSTRFGQELSILTEIDKDSPVGILKDIIKVREEVFKKRYGDRTVKQVKEAEVANIKKQVKKTTSQEWSDFISSIETC